MGECFAPAAGVEDSSETSKAKESRQNPAVILRETEWLGAGYTSLSQFDSGSFLLGCRDRHQTIAVH
jgi:hypothetical protein